MKAPYGYKLGKAQKLQDCCRMIRMFPPVYVGQLLSGYNSSTDEQEEYIVLKINKNYHNSIVQRIYKL